METCDLFQLLVGFSMIYGFDEGNFLDFSSFISFYSWKFRWEMLKLESSLIFGKLLNFFFLKMQEKSWKNEETFK